MNGEKKIVLFDGLCNLCNSSVQFIVKRDKKNQFQFASLQSRTGSQILEKFNISPGNLYSFMLLEDEKLYTKSTGALRVLKILGRGWQLYYGFIVIPKFIRDAVYDIIAKNRYKWFGKRAECWVPTGSLQSKFLD